MNPLKQDPKLSLLLLDISDLDKEIESTEDLISQLSKSLSTKDSPSRNAPDEFFQLFTRKENKFKTFLDLCTQESQKTAYLKSLESSQKPSPPQCQNQSSNSIIWEKFDLSPKIRQIQQQISSLDSELSYHRSLHPPSPLQFSSDPILFVSLILVLLGGFIQLTL